MWEKYPAFCERMISKHAGAQLLKSSTEPPNEIKFGTALYIQCTQVTPEPDRTLPIFINPDVPPSVRQYYEHKSVILFLSSLLLNLRIIARSTHSVVLDRSPKRPFKKTSHASVTPGRRRHILQPKNHSQRF